MRLFQWLKSFFVFEEDDMNTVVMQKLARKYADYENHPTLTDNPSPPSQENAE